MVPYMMKILCLGARAIIHVGPHKTGSTSLQQTLAHYRRILARDNFDLFPNDLPGVGYWNSAKSGANVANCLANTARIQLHHINCTMVLGYFTQWLHTAHSANRGVVLSAEMFDHDRMDIPALASALQRFDTSILVMHRPYFDWLRSMYSQARPAMPLEEYASTGRISSAAAGRDSSSVAVYKRYAQHFRDVRMRPLANGYIRKLLCTDVQAKAVCRLMHSAREVHSNAHKSTTYFNGTGCMDGGQWELLWNVSVGIEAQAQTLIGAGSVALNLTELRAQYVDAPYRVCSETPPRPAGPG
jgi:hypothetical protein